MLRAAIAFFVLALVAYIFGASGFAGMSAEIGRILLMVFLALAVISFIVNLVSGRRGGSLPAFFLVPFLAIASSALIGCDTFRNRADQAASQPNPETETAANQLNASKVREVNFEKNSHVLTEGSREALREMVREARTNGEIDEVKILAWGDVAYPADRQADVSDREKELAEKRAAAIESFVKSDLELDSVETYNMTERPNAMQELFDTEGSRVKEAFENAGVTSSSGKSLTGSASRAVVLVTTENEKRSE